MEFCAAPLATNDISGLGPGWRFRRSRNLRCLDESPYDAEHRGLRNESRVWGMSLPTPTEGSKTVELLIWVPNYSRVLYRNPPYKGISFFGSSRGSGYMQGLGLGASRLKVLKTTVTRNHKASFLTPNPTLNFHSLHDLIL